MEFSFWAKTTDKGFPGITVKQHLESVGYVARQIAKQFPKVLELFDLDADLIAAIAALHDIGKISPGFQRKCIEWLRQHDLIETDTKWNWEMEMESDHGKTSHATIQKLLNSLGFARKSSSYLATVIGGHHGKLNRPSDRGYRPGGSIEEQVSGIDWEAERFKTAKQIWDSFYPKAKDPGFGRDSPALWWIAGLTSVADWIGSDATYFTQQDALTLAEIESLAIKALDKIGPLAARVKSNLSFESIFGFPPNEMQLKALATITKPGVYVIEAPMGLGKTEAALGVAYNLISQNLANGLYFALPTQVTSNRIYLRLLDFLRVIDISESKSRLIHGNSWLFNNEPEVSPGSTHFRTNSDEDARKGRDWFHSSKRALIAPYGVGTVDQALLGVVAAKHFFIRHFALAGKVVILDEIHSYDIYTGTLIDKLIKTLIDLGCTVIVLSATLTAKKRSVILGEKELSEQGYPLITGKERGKPIKPAIIKPPKDKRIDVLFKKDMEAADIACDLASKGGAVL